MPAVEVRYGGDVYHIAGRDVEDVASEVLTATRHGGGWLQAVDGGGPARLLISPGVCITLMAAPADVDDTD